MRAIGAGEARPHLPDLLKAAEHGETIVITRRGAPIARIMPLEPAASTDPGAAIARIRSARAGRAAVSCADLLSARDEGRKP